MTESAHLVLEDGSAYKGYAFGARTSAHGEVVFATSMTGYQEMLTDPSFAGQIVVPTYPLQGNYGINDADVESKQVQVAAFVVREQSPTPSHYDSNRTLHDYLATEGIAGIHGVDTRAVTRRIRSQGVMMGAVTTGEPQAALAELSALPSYDAVNFVERVTVGKGYAWPASGASGKRVAVVDCGVKYNILRLLAKRGCRVSVLPATASAEEVLALEPDGVVFSPGPGDPVHNTVTVETAKAIIERVPTLGICLGHQVIARALGGQTYKLKFGHRGANHPVQDLETGRVVITAQNHGYAVSDDSLPPDIVVTHRNLNDGTIEGLRHRERPVLTIQYHSEASPGPLDSEYVFDRFLEMMA
ncbi:MAG: glutamine-hydrolyzing carbamoyl-phosphate synthase small subunit [Chloroflexi bacterium]|nr:glutamine-hydrolyzing carbamoyl-phosphate synthase small subunit [Chloroflexota bacterium]